MLRSGMHPSTWLRCKAGSCSGITEEEDSTAQVQYAEWAANYLNNPQGDVPVSRWLCESAYGYAAIAAAFSSTMDLDVWVVRYPKIIDDGEGIHRFWSKGDTPVSGNAACNRPSICVVVVDVGNGKFRSTVQL